MEAQILTTVAVGALLAMLTSIIAWQGKGRFEAMEKRLDRIEDQFADLRRDFNDLRRDFNQLVLALGPRTQPQTG